jgi:HK97 family phage major capsid protein
MAGEPNPDISSASRAAPHRLARTLGRVTRPNPGDLKMKMEPRLKVGAPASVAALLAATALARLPLFNVVDAVIAQYRERQTDLLDSSTALVNLAEAENRDLTADEQRQVAGLADEFDTLENQIAIRQRVVAQTAVMNTPAGRRTEPSDPGVDPPANRAVPAPGMRAEPRPRVTANGNGGFRSFGDFAVAVRNAGRHGADQVDPRLRNAAAASFGQESVGADGGFAVPPDFRSEIAIKVFGEDSLVARTDRQRTSSNSMTIPTDMTAPWDNTGGIQAYWDGEANVMTQSKPKLEEVTYKAHKLHCLVPVTEELLEDAPSMDAYLRKKAPEKLDFKLSNAIVRGNGAGMPLGFLNSQALVTVAAEGSQAAATIVTANISKMFARMPASSRKSAVWLVNPDATEQLDLLTVGQQPVYMPPGGISEAPYGRIKGRPVIEHQVCDIVGNLGDIMFVDFEQYMSLTKIGGGRDDNGMKTDVSMHLWFDQDLVAYKFTIRIGGQPWWSQATTPLNGSNKLSPFVTLAAR